MLCKNVDSKGHVPIFLRSTLKRQFVFSRQFNRALQVEKIERAFFGPPVNFTATVTPKQNSYSFLFYAARWFENPACFKDRETFA